MKKVNPRKVRTRLGSISKFSLLPFAFVLLSLMGFSILIYKFYYRETPPPSAPQPLPSGLYYLSMALLVLVGFIPLLLEIMPRRMSSLAQSLYYRARIVDALALLIIAALFTCVILLFYFLNRAGVPTIIQVAGNSFLGMFIILNIIHWLNSINTNRNS